MKGAKAMVSERMLKKWRREALSMKFRIENETEHDIRVELILGQAEIILQLTQSLMDLHLLKKEVKD